jgi:uncharacterized Zn-binding protein involved in type VI secretion
MEVARKSMRQSASSAPDVRIWRPFAGNLGFRGEVVMPPIARLTDMHTCPMSTGPVPHVGGPIAGPGAPTVLVGGLPAACVGDVVTCVGPPDAIVAGCFKVLVGGRPVAIMGGSTAHGGVIVAGCPTVQAG